jgi:hypothetical protein
MIDLAHRTAGRARLSSFEGTGVDLSAFAREASSGGSAEALAKAEFFDKFE